MLPLQAPHSWLVTMLVLLLMALGTTGAAAAPPRRVCSISDAASLASCFAAASRFDDFAFVANVSCTTATSCCPDKRAPMFLQGVADKRILGQGHVLRREAGQHTCPVMILRQAHDITISGLTLDEDARVPPCELKEHTCPSTIDIASSRTVHLEQVRVFDGKGYVIKLWACDGFSFDRGTLVRAGIIGLYVGHYKYGPSHDIRITNSVFVRSRTNAIALQGAYASDPAQPVLVADNVFIDNHWHGLWPIPGGVTTGGQVFIGDGANIRVSGNIISGHRCENCFRSQHVSSIEIGESLPAPAGVAGLAIADNTLIGTEESGYAIQQNPRSLVSGVSIAGNTVLGYQALDNVHVPARHDANRVVPTPRWEVSGSRLAAAPRPGVASSVVFLCIRTQSRGAFQTPRRDCAGAGRVVAVLGFSPKPRANPAPGQDEAKDVPS